MERRRFLQVTGTATLGITATLAGCPATSPGRHGPDGGAGGVMADGIGTGGPIPVAPAITPDQADVTVTTADQLEREATTGRGRIIWIPGDAQIDLSGRSFTTQNTIASDRSQERPGALIFTNDMGESSHAYSGGSGLGLIQLGAGGRLHGLRIRGPTYDYWANPNYPGYIESMPDSQRRQMFSRAVSILGDPARVDNCELYGFSTHAIVVGEKYNPVNPAIHYCAIHNNMQTSYGYGVDTKRGHPHIFRCWFDAHRHAVNGYGYSDCGYTVEECTFGPHTSSHIIDMHGIHNNAPDGGSADPTSFRWRYRAGGTMEIINSTIMATHVIPDATMEGGEPTTIAHLRGIPADGMYFVGNQFAHPRPPETNVGRQRRALVAWRQNPIPSGIATNALGFVGLHWEQNQWNLDFDGDGRPGVTING